MNYLLLGLVIVVLVLTFAKKDATVLDDTQPPSPSSNATSIMARSYASKLYYCSNESPEYSSTQLWFEGDITFNVGLVAYEDNTLTTHAPAGVYEYEIFLFEIIDGVVTEYTCPDSVSLAWVDSYEVACGANTELTFTTYYLTGGKKGAIMYNDIDLTSIANAGIYVLHAEGDDPTLCVVDNWGNIRYTSCPSSISLVAFSTPTLACEGRYLVSEASDFYYQGGYSQGVFDEGTTLYTDSELTITANAGWYKNNHEATYIVDENGVVSGYADACPPSILVVKAKSFVNACETAFPDEDFVKLFYTAPLGVGSTLYSDVARTIKAAMGVWIKGKFFFDLSMGNPVFTIDSDGAILSIDLCPIIIQTLKFNDLTLACTGAVVGQATSLYIANEPAVGQTIYYDITLQTTAYMGVYNNSGTLYDVDDFGVIQNIITTCPYFMAVRDSTLVNVCAGNYVIKDYFPVFYSGEIAVGSALFSDASLETSETAGFYMNDDDGIVYGVDEEGIVQSVGPCPPPFTSVQLAFFAATTYICTAGAVPLTYYYSSRSSLETGTTLYSESTLETPVATGYYRDSNIPTAYYTVIEGEITNVSFCV